MIKVIIGMVVAIIILGGGYLLFNSNKLSPIPSAKPVVSTPTVLPTTSVMPAAVQNTITLTAKGFDPVELTVPANTEVIWRNNSGDNAAINSNPHPIHTDHEPLNLGKFSDGETLSLIFNKLGTFKYHNHLNLSQTGTIIVK